MTNEQMRGEGGKLPSGKGGRSGLNSSERPSTNENMGSRAQVGWYDWVAPRSGGYSPGDVRSERKNREELNYRGWIDGRRVGNDRAVVDQSEAGGPGIMQDGQGRALSIGERDKEANE